MMKLEGYLALDQLEECVSPAGLLAVTENICCFCWRFHLVENGDILLLEDGAELNSQKMTPLCVFVKLVRNAKKKRIYCVEYIFFVKSAASQLSPKQMKFKLMKCRRCPIHADFRDRQHRHQKT